MAALRISDELHAAIELEVREQGYADAAEYLARLVRQDRKRRAKEEMELLFMKASEQ